MKEELENHRNFPNDVSPTAVGIMIESNACTSIIQLFENNLISSDI